MAYPMDVMKTLIQSDKGENTLRQKEVIKRLLAKNGFFALFKGVETCLVRAFLVNAVFFYVNEIFSNYLKERKIAYEKLNEREGNYKMI